MEVINLNLIPTGALPVVHASQYDEGRTFRANLMDGSTVYTLDGTEVLECDVKKPDGNIVTVAVTNTSDSFITIDTTLQMCACAGDSLGELHITKGAQEIGTLNFILAVERSPLENGIQSDSGIHNLQTQIGDAVADQYAAEDVVFDATPTAGHGVGFAVTSEGVKTALDEKANTDDLAPVATSGDYNDLDNLPTIPENLPDLGDVEITSPTAGQIIEYDDNDGKWKNVANPASTANFADAYDPTATYNTGDVCIYNNVLYICNEDNITGTFDPSKWTATTIDNVIGSLSTLTTTDKSSIVGAVNEVNGKKLDKDFEIGTRSYICICGSTQTANNKQLFINFSLCKQRTITVNSITTSGDATEYKTKFTLADNSANGYITLYSADSSVVHGRLYTVNLTIA